MFVSRRVRAGCAFSISTLAAVWVSSAFAGDVTVPDNTTATGQKTVNGSDKVTVGAGGKLTSSANATILENRWADGIVIDNSGTIESTAWGARGIRFKEGSHMTFTIINREGAVIQATDDAIQVSPSVTSGTIVVTNSGTIQSTATGQGIDFSNITSGTASITITNTATGVITAAGSDAVRPGAGAVVNNHGRIFGTNNGATLDNHDPNENKTADGVDFQGSPGGVVNNFAGGSIIGIQHGINFGKSGSGTVNNDGTIEGGHHGINNGLDNNTNSPDSVITVNNGANGRIIGHNGSGVGLDTSGVVVNHGLISGRGNPNAVNADGDGVDIDYFAKITNHGRIEGIGSRGVGSEGHTNTSEGIAIGGGIVDNKAGAVIIGSDNGILVDNSSKGNAYYSVTITNAGTIEGTNGFGIKIVSALDNVITNSGTITGGNGVAILFGSGNDTLNLLTGSVINGIVDGGDGTDTINLNGTGTLGNTTNFETLKVQSGTWTLTGTQGYSSGTSVASGATMFANGVLTSAVTVADGGTVGGTGTIIGDLDLAGTVSPGAGNGQVATLTVNGNVVFAPTAIFKIDVTATGAADKLAIAGTAALAGSVRVSAQSGNWAPNTTVTFLSARGGLNGRFSSVLSDLAFLTPTLSYTSQTVSLTLTRNTQGFQSVAQTANQNAVAGVLSNAPTSNKLFLAVVGQSAAGARTVFEALSGEGLTSAATGALQAGRAFGQALQTRSFGAGPGTPARGTTGAPGMMALGVRSAAATNAAAQALPSRLRLWASAFDERTSTGSDAGSAAQSGRQSGIATGADMQVAPNIMAGLALGYSDGGISTEDRATRVNTTGYHLGGYGVQRFGSVYLSGSVNVGVFDNNSKRMVVAGNLAEYATASFSSAALSGRIELGQDFNLAGTRVTPFLSFEAARYFAGSYQEQSVALAGGAGAAALLVQGARTDAAPASLGVRLRQDYALASGMSLAPSLSVAWVHNFAQGRTQNASFVQLPGASFSVAGVRADADLLQARAGLDMRLAPNVVLGAEVGTEQGARTQNVSARGDVRITW